MLLAASVPWNDPSTYNFTSSEWGGVAVKVVGALLILVFFRWLWQRHVRKHYECHVDVCSAIGRPVHGTGYRACHPHDPTVTHEPGEAITPEHIAEAHRRWRQG